MYSKFLQKISIKFFIFLMISTHIQAQLREVEIVNNTDHTITFTDYQTQLHTMRPRSCMWKQIETTSAFHWAITSTTNSNVRTSSLDPDCTTIYFESRYGAHVTCSGEADFITRMFRRIVLYTDEFCNGFSFGLLTNRTEIVDSKDRGTCHICYTAGMVTMLYTIGNLVKRVKVCVGKRL